MNSSARCCFFFFQAEDGIRDYKVTGVQTCALPISSFDHSDDARLASAWRRHAYGQSVKGRYGDAADESERALRHARAGGERFEEGRSGERRVGKECRSRWSPYH